MPAKARVCAYTVLRRVFEQGAYAEKALHSASNDLDSRDRALAMRLAYGAIQRKLTLDHTIGQLTERPLQRLDAPVLAALRLGLYELLYLSGAPDRAVVADAVELAKLARSPGYGLVNAALRRAAREGADGLLAGLGEETPERAAVMHSHPVWLARMWWEQLGSERARSLMAADNEPGELALRVNSLRADPRGVANELGVPTRTDPELPEALVVESALDLHRTRAWREGAVVAQSRAAMLVARVLDPQPGERVLDLCAAPGGKSTHIAALMGGEGEVAAVERNPARAERLRETARRLGATNVTVEVADAALPRAGDETFDRVLVDPPCSGLGTLQARPDLRWRGLADRRSRRSPIGGDPADGPGGWASHSGIERGSAPERIRELVALQKEILTAGARSLRPGGTLVYSTCTISAAENEQLLEQFLSKNSDFILDDLAREWTSHPHPRAQRFLLTLPDRDRTAGFFIARIRRKPG
ncbi:MAG TPA: transcription antitermination factor NusB [Solirubrobacteraceae bacterium]|jgi:16S rRNA (cytosine967-C5)-methyltransferase|nr:transcription antitermination factor NusB [Solirubrobacteraceae bacterium]